MHTAGKFQILNVKSFKQMGQSKQVAVCIVLARYSGVHVCNVCIVFNLGRGPRLGTELKCFLPN